MASFPPCSSPGRENISAFLWVRQLPTGSGLNCTMNDYFIWVEAFDSTGQNLPCLDIGIASTMFLMVFATHLSTMDAFIKCIQLLKIHQITFLMMSFIGYKLGTGEAEKTKIPMISFSKIMNFGSLGNTDIFYTYTLQKI